MHASSAVQLHTPAPLHAGNCSLIACNTDTTLLSDCRCNQTSNSTPQRRCYPCYHAYPHHAEHSLDITHNSCLATSTINMCSLAKQTAITSITCSWLLQATKLARPHKPFLADMSAAEKQHPSLEAADSISQNLRTAKSKSEVTLHTRAHAALFQSLLIVCCCSELCLCCCPVLLC